MLEKKHKVYLESLRVSGVTNMFGAAPYLEAEFGLSRAEARKVLSEWMNTYDPNDPDYDEDP